MWTLKIDGKSYTMNNEADYEYRSHIEGMAANSPDNWVSNHGTDEDGNEIVAWYFIENSDETALDEIDYENPDDIVDEYGHIIYDSEAEE